jgi:hypothetical protein
LHCQISRLQFHCFHIWHSELNAVQLLHRLHDSLSLTRNYTSWWTFTRSRPLEKDHGAHLSARLRSHSQRRFWDTWRNLIHLTRLYKAYDRNSDILFGRRFVKALILSTEKAKF